MTHRQLYIFASMKVFATPKRACVIRCQKHLRLAKRHIIERIADIKIPDERSKPFEKLEWAGGKKALTLQSI